MKKKLLCFLISVTMLFGQAMTVMATDDVLISTSENTVEEEEYTVAGEYLPGNTAPVNDIPDPYENVRHLTYKQIIADNLMINDKSYPLDADLSYFRQVLYTGKKIKADKHLFTIISSASLDALAMELSGAKDVRDLVKWTFTAKKNKKCSDKAYFTVKASVRSKIARSIKLKGKALRDFKKGIKKLNKAAKSKKFYFSITKTLDPVDSVDEEDINMEIKPAVINSANFPDDTFRNILSGSDYDKDGNGTLDEKEISEILNIYCEGKGIKSLKGIEYFTALQGLWCKDNEISEMDLSHNRDLRGIWCSGNRFTELDFTPNPRLVWVYCFDCELKSLNVSNNPRMAYIECNTNPLTRLDVTHNPELEHLTCGTCEITSLDLSNCPMLSHLDAFQNKLTSIDLSNNPKMKRLDIWNNEGLGNVDISTLKDLEYYNCANNGVTGTLDMSKNPHLMMLNCGWNRGITALDISKNPELAWMNCGSCSIGTLDLSHNPKLYFLWAFDNSFKTLNIGDNPRLMYVYNNGVYADAPNVGGWEKSIDHGGSHEYFDELDYWFCIGNGVTVTTTTGNTADVSDSHLDTNDGLTSSDNILTREAAMQKLYEMAGKPAVSGSSDFSDVAGGSAYDAAITWGKQNHICFGYPNIYSDTFGLGQSVTREDLALMIHRYAEYEKYKSAFDYGRTDNFSDFFDIDFYAWGAFTWAIQWEILPKRGNFVYPHGRVTVTEFNSGLDTLLELNGVSR